MLACYGKKLAAASSSLSFMLVTDWYLPFLFSFFLLAELFYCWSLKLQVNILNSIKNKHYKPFSPFTSNSRRTEMKDTTPKFYFASLLWPVENSASYLPMNRLKNWEKIKNKNKKRYKARAIVSLYIFLFNWSFPSMYLSQLLPLYSDSSNN